MAQQVTITLVDDIDGSEAAETVNFALDGTTYDIDLNEAHAEALREAIAQYVAVGRRAGRASRRRHGTTAKRGTSAAAAVREWGRSNGYDVPDRGRIPAAIQEAYDAAK